MYRTYDGWWKADVWLGWWVNVFSVGNLTAPWEQAAIFEAGQEIWAENGDLGNIDLPVNFVHKLMIRGASNSSLRPWSDTVLEDPLKGITESISDSPLQVMDLFPGEYTSEASHNIH